MYFGEVCGKYLIHPDIWAFQGSSRIDTDSLYSFSIYLRINDTSGTDVQVSADQIREVISIDSMKVIFNASSVEIWKSPMHEGLLRGNGNPGLSYYFGDITIPSEIDSITVVVPISNRKLDIDDLIGCDTLFFQMHRKESSSIGPLLN